jgi:hypothetical protein
MTTKKLAEIEKLLSGIIPIKSMGIANDNSRSGLVGRTRIHLCEHTHKGDQCFVQIVCGEMLTVYESCKVTIEDTRIIFSNRGQRTVVWTGERK